MSDRPELSLELVEEAGDWDVAAAEAALGPIAAAIAARVAGAAGIATVVLADDASVRDLNSRFRGIDKPTNVLSFPSGEAPGRDVTLGDVILARETLEREAALDGKPADHHFIHLAVHGILHLLGYDHEQDRDAEVMEGLETAILADLGLPDPYAETASLNEV